MIVARLLKMENKPYFGLIQFQLYYCEITNNHLKHNIRQMIDKGRFAHSPFIVEKRYSLHLVLLMMTRKLFGSSVVNSAGGLPFRRSAS